MMTERDSPIVFHTRTACWEGEYVPSESNADPVPLEVIQVEDDGLLRVRCLDWPAGYSAVLPADQVRQVADMPTPK